MNGQNVVDVQYGQTKIALQPAFNEQNYFIDFHTKETGGTSQWNSPVQSKANASTPSVPGQKCFKLNLIIFRFFSEANLSIVATPHHLAVNILNKSSVTYQSS